MDQPALRALFAVDIRARARAFVGAVDAILHAIANHFLMHATAVRATERVLGTRVLAADRRVFVAPVRAVFVAWRKAERTRG